MKKVINLENNTIEFIFGGEGAETTVTVSVNDFSQEVVSHAVLHGLSQKIGDSAAAAKAAASVEGETRSIEELRQVMVQGCIQHLQENGWSAPRKAGNSTKDRKTVTAKIETVKNQLMAFPAGKKRKEAHDLMKRLMGLDNDILTGEEIDQTEVE